MVLPWSSPLAGCLDEHVVDSAALRDNPLGDPHERPLWVYVPPGYDEAAGPVPSIYVIQGYTGQVAMWRNRNAYRQPFLETVDAVFASGQAPPCLVVFVDAWSAYGGSQFVDSPGTGRYHSYLCDDVVSFVDQRYRTIDAPASRAITGKSSGGYGAMITPMLRPDLFGALATHAGDALHEYCYTTEIADAVRHLRDYGGDVWAWWADFRSRVAFTKEEDSTLLMVLGISACYSADPDGTPVLPMDPVSGAIRPEVWQRWLDADPVRMVPRYASACRDLHAVWIDAGKRDDYYLDLGAIAYRDALVAAGLPEDRIAFELFDGTHSAIEYRYPLAVEWLAQRMQR